MLIPRPYHYLSLLPLLLLLLPSIVSGSESAPNTLRPRKVKRKAEAKKSARNNLIPSLVGSALRPRKVKRKAAAKKSARNNPIPYLVGSTFVVLVVGILAVHICDNQQDTSKPARPLPINTQKFYERLTKDYQAPEKATKRSNKLREDSNLIEELKKQGYKAPIERGGGGDCLFYAMAAQITAEEMKTLPLLLGVELEALCNQCNQCNVINQCNEWDILNKTQTGLEIEKANLLRAIAMHIETFLMAEIAAKRGRQGEKLKELFNNEGIKDFVHILYQDMREEEGVEHTELRKEYTDTALEEKWKYCQEHFEIYKENTKNQGNWAGTPEAFALALALERPLVIYGNDWASSEDVGLNKDNNILPFYSRAWGGVDKEPITIFQTSGGGHYRQLAKV